MLGSTHFETQGLGGCREVLFTGDGHCIQKIVSLSEKRRSLRKGGARRCSGHCPGGFHDFACGSSGKHIFEQHVLPTAAPDGGILEFSRISYVFHYF